MVFHKGIFSQSTEFLYSIRNPHDCFLVAGIQHAINRRILSVIILFRKKEFCKWRQFWNHSIIKFRHCNILHFAIGVFLNRSEYRQCQWSQQRAFAYDWNSSIRFRIIINIIWEPFRKNHWFKGIATHYHLCPKFNNIIRKFYLFQWGASWESIGINCAILCKGCYWIRYCYWFKWRTTGKGVVSNWFKVSIGIKVYLS